MSNLNNNTTQLEALLAKVNALPEAGGVDTSDATATPGDILSDKTAYVNGEKITGVIKTRTSSDLVSVGAIVTVPSGYYSTQVGKAVATATQATPTVAIDTTNGLITATATQSTGYVTGGTRTATQQLAFQPAQTITPGTTDKTIAANTYLGGVQTIKGDANLVASNIVSGKSIFGVVGTATTGSSGGNTDAEDGLITRTLSTYTNDRVKTIGSYAFYSCTSLTRVSFPAATTIGSYAFNTCTSLTSVSFPAATTIGSYAFYNCTRLTSVSLPAATTIGSSAFKGCASLTSVSFPAATTIGGSAFARCTSLSIIYLGASSVCKLDASKAFMSTGIGSTKGSIFVPASLLTSYQTATNWAFFKNRIFAYVPT